MSKQQNNLITKWRVHEFEQFKEKGTKTTYKEF